MHTALDESFGALLKRYRRAAGLSQEALAERARLSPAAISALERGARRAPYRDTVHLLAEALELSPEDRTALMGSVDRRRRPPPAASIIPSAHLRLSLTSFIGRERETDEIQRTLLSNRLVTLTGSGGVGKTRLALEVASGVAAFYSGGFCFVDLAPVTEPALTAQTVVHALGLREEPGHTATATLTHYLEPRELLLLLDNCEHMVAACAPLVEGLLRDCSALRILATSREPLNITGELAWRVPSLSLPDGTRHAFPAAPPAVHRLERPVETLFRSEAVRLFVERALSASPDFTVTSANAPAVVEVCIRLDGIPLALELAAARMRVLSVQQLAARLHDRFQLLTKGGRTAAPRHQTLRGAVDWSYELLSQPERALFRRLSTFAGGWTLEASESVCAGDGIEGHEVLDLLSQLVDKSLVLAEPRGVEKRYRLLDTLRQYGAERLQESRETAAVRDRHLAWFRGLAERADPELYRADQAAWHERLETEIDNIRAALDWSKTDTARLDAGLRLAGALWRFWYSQGRLIEGWERLVALLGLAPATVAGAEHDASRAARAVALNAAGRLGEYLTQLDAARSFIEEALTLNRSLGDRLGTAVSLHNLGLVAIREGDFPLACSFLAESAAIMRTLGGRGLTHTALLHLGRAVFLMGDAERAEAVWTEALLLARSHGDYWAVAATLEQLGELALRRGHLAAANKRFRETLSLEAQIGNVGAMIRSLQAWAELAALEGRPERAVRLAGAAAGLRGAAGTTVVPALEATMNVRMDAARQALGETAASNVWAEGTEMSLEQAVAYAMES